MKHYICTGGCGGVLEKPGTCQAEDCAKYKEPLEKCECKDGTHNGAFELAQEETNEDE